MFILCILCPFYPIIYMIRDEIMLNFPLFRKKTLILQIN